MIEGKGPCERRLAARVLEEVKTRSNHRKDASSELLSCQGNKEREGRKARRGQRTESTEKQESLAFFRKPILGHDKDIYTISICLSIQHALVRAAWAPKAAYTARGWYLNLIRGVTRHGIPAFSAWVASVT